MIHNCAVQYLQKMDINHKVNQVCVSCAMELQLKTAHVKTVLN